ncbi:MAG: class I SAM-dependent methyltransferase [Solirubrobacterales bacterium]|nr:class I SAM-dependent methyltransferase [Solirubrobacterales bacterium]
MRSLAHWSEAGRAEMEAFYALARQDYRHLAGSVDWSAVLRFVLGERQDLRLLDVACGSGKFPEALLAQGRLDALDGAGVRYDLLDPSAFSLSEARRALAPPLFGGRDLQTTLEELDPALMTPEGYDVVWATHALYALGPVALRDGLERFLDVLTPGGLGFLGHASETAHYLRFYKHFLSDVRGGEGTPFRSSEDIVAALHELGAQPTVRRISYTAQVAEREAATLEGYLQRCVFDDTVALDDMLAAPGMGAYLREARGADGRYRFVQHVDLVFVGLPDALAGGIELAYAD